MTRKTRKLKLRLGRKLKQSRRIPLVARLRTHRRLQQNRYARNWRQRKMRLKVDEE
jgi:ribosomal protein L39E